MFYRQNHSLSTVFLRIINTFYWNKFIFVNCPPNHLLRKQKKLDDIIQFQWKQYANILCPMGTFFVSFILATSTLPYWLTFILLDFHNTQTCTLSPFLYLPMSLIWSNKLQNNGNRINVWRIDSGNFDFIHSVSFIQADSDVLDRNMSALYTQLEHRIYWKER